MGFVTAVLQIKGILVQYFEPARFRRVEPNQELGEIGSVSMDLVCEGLMSIWWWGYCCVLVASGGGVFELQCKVQECKCHPAQAFYDDYEDEA